MEHTISVLIVEDEEIWLESISRILDGFGYKVAGMVSSVADALTAFSSLDYDLILMDIHLDGNNSGIELGKIVNKLYHKPFIFVTASSGHMMLEAADTHPSAYLTKPINASSLFIAIQNAINNFHNDRPAQSVNENNDLTSFFVKQGSRYKKIDWKDIAYLSAGKNYTSVFNAPDKTDYYIRSSLQKILQQIIPKQLQKHFIQVNRAEAVQLSFIEEFVNGDVKTPFKSFPVSEAFNKELRTRLNIVS
jgi:DNA-binding LytR/AlgR family response regulator